MTQAPAPQTRSGAQAVERAVSVLRTLEATEDPLGVTEIAQQTGFTISTAHRLARALTDAGLLSQDDRTERYQLGPALIVLGAKAADRLGYRRALPTLRELATATGESVSLGIRTGNEVHVVLHVPSPQPLRFDQQPGTAVPLHISAMGKCLLAGGGDIDTQLDSLGRLTRATDRSITNRKQLRTELEQVRERGWALNDQERNAGVRAIAVPVLHPDGGALAAIAIQGPAVRITDDRLPKLATQLNKTAKTVAPILAASPRE